MAQEIAPSQAAINTFVALIAKSGIEPDMNDWHNFHQTVGLAVLEKNEKIKTAKDFEKLAKRIFNKMKANKYKHSKKIN